MNVRIVRSSLKNGVTVMRTTTEQAVRNVVAVLKKLLVKSTSDGDTWTKNEIQQ